ncbi:MAG: ATP-dependent Clp protease ATP-binding subunit [Bacilli bacterium]|nr:ATP-dependent Clp protease ATP-binding subunit [Bacilli bacterium]
MFHNFGFEVAELLEIAEQERVELRHPYVGSEHLLLAILKQDKEVAKKLKNVGLTYAKFRQELLDIMGSSSKVQELILYTPLLKRILEIALEDAEENNNGHVTTRHLLLAMLEEGEGIAIRIMISMNIDIDDLYDSLKKKKSSKKERDNLEIYKIGVVLNDVVNKEEVVVGREKELDSMIETLLRKKKNNPLLVGKAGVGKTALVEELVRRIGRNEVPESLENMEVIMLEMGSLVAGTKYRGEFEERLTKLIREIIENKHIILFIDEIHSMVNAGGAEGAINASDILKPYLARGELKCIGATTTEEYYKFIEKDKALNRRFEIIHLEEPTLEQTKEILLKVKKEYENHHRVKISTQNIDDILKLGNDYLFSAQNPDKSLELLDSVCARVKTKKEKKTNNPEKKLQKLIPKKEQLIREGNFEEALLLTKEENRLKNASPSKKRLTTKIETKDIMEVIEQKTGIPLLESKEERLAKIETQLRKTIIGQDEALTKIMATLGKKRSPKRPLSFLLLGPTGVGKTETVKQISKAFNQKNNLIRLDMSEFSLDTSIHKLIGTPGGYVGYGEPYLFQKLKENPYRIILVDELEKAGSRVWNLFLQILDEGFITDSMGEKIYFDKSIIFMTSNLEQKDCVGFAKRDNKELEETLSKEFLGRFDAIINYQKITKEIALEFMKRQKKTSEQIEKILQESDYEQYGLRNLSLMVNRLDKDFQTN